MGLSDNQKERITFNKLPENLAANWDDLAALLKTRLTRFGEIAGEISFLIDMPAFDAELYVNKRKHITAVFHIDVIVI